MSKIEKKFSDFQTNECDEQIVEQPVDERLCPSCFPNDSFSLPDQWFNIEEAYLNEKTCEYSVRIYEVEANRKLKFLPNSTTTTEAAVIAGIEKILNQFNKLSTSDVVDSLINSAFLAETSYGPDATLYGESYLIVIPSFNFDMVPDSEDEPGEEDDVDLDPPTEVIVKHKNLFKRTIQLGSALRVYDMLYAAAQQIGEYKGITLVYENDPITRVSFLGMRFQLATFRRLLNLALRQNNFEGIDYPSLIRRRYKKIKFILSSNPNKPFLIKSIYVLSENCEDEYTKLRLHGDTLQLTRPGFETIVNFFANFDKVISDITAKETKPWLEFSLDNVYPKLVANYGEYGEITEEDYRMVGCLFENSLGIGNGQITDFLARETLSFFKVLENDAYKSACRSINQLREPTEDSEARAKTSEDLRAERTKSTYREQYLNFVYDSLFNTVKFRHPEITNITKDNVFGILESDAGILMIEEPTYKYKDDNGDRQTHRKKLEITTKIKLDAAAATYADKKYANLNNAWSTRFKNNADWEEMKESYSEAFQPENGFLNYLFGTDPNENDNAGVEDERTILNTIGLCGMTKLTGKMLQCLLGGMTIDDFYDLLAEKAMEFMEVNTLGLFLNALPLSFRDNLNQALAEQFGDINLEQLIGIKAEDGSSMKDIVGFSKPNAIMKAFERSSDPLNDPKITPDDKEFLVNNIGEGQFYDVIMENYSILYDRSLSEYISLPNGAEFVIPSTAGTDNQQSKNYKTAKKYIKKVVKHARRSYLKGSDTFTQANTKLKKTVDLFGDYDRGDSKDQLERSLNSNERISKAFQQSNMGTKVDAVYDVIFDFVIDYILGLMNVDQLIQILNQFPGADLAFGFISDFLKSCPHPPLFHPPAADFMKSFSLDVCDPEMSMKMPKMNFPSLSLRYNLEKQFGDNFRNAIVALVTKIAINMLKRIMNFLEDALCKTIGAVGAFVAEGIQNGNLIQGAKDNFQKALDQLFCGGSTNPDTGKSRASELANGLFQPALAISGVDYEGAGDKVSNIISSVVSQDEILRAVVDGDTRANKMISNAINALAPEMAVLLGTPSQVATFFRNLKSYLPQDDRDRIRDMLNAGIPNLPLTSNICLTNDQLKAWNDLRNSLLRGASNYDASGAALDGTDGGAGGLGGLTPEQAADKVAKLNEAVADALEQTIGDALNLDNPDGPFIGAITDEALKDVCNPDNLFNDVSQSELSKQESQSLNEQTFNLILRIMMISFNGRNGIFGNAMRARDNTREGVVRNLRKFFNSNYANTQLERDAIEGAKGTIGAAIMNSLTQDKSVIGEYPLSVGISLRDQLLANGSYNLPFAFSSVYEEGENQSYYKSRQKFQDLNKNQDLSYDFRFISKLGSGEIVGEDYILPINYSLSESEREYLETIGVQIESNSVPLRQEIFQRFMDTKIGLQKDHSELYNSVFEELASKTIHASVTNASNSGSVSTGYLFGYVSEDVTKEDFEYLNPSESTDPEHPPNAPYSYSNDQKVLGYYDHPRLKVLSPELYGGRYTNPPYTYEPRKFVGWLEFATKAFESQEGCDPKRPPMFSLTDIKNRVEYLEQNLKNYPEMTKDKDCVIEKPFKLLINNKTRAKMDGIVRTTLRCYIGEYFLKGVGTFSNIQLTPENYDQAYSSYVANNIKREMSLLGSFAFNSRKSITHERYWYLFLEQAVQTYQTMYDLGEIMPSKSALEALEEFHEVQSIYEGVTRSIKKEMKRIILDVEVRPSMNDRKNLLKKPEKLAIYAMDFRLSEDKENYFESGPIDPRVNIGLIRRSSVKKLDFFTKIFTIKMYEKEAMLILGELIALESARLSETAFNGLNDKPKIYDMNKSFIGLKEIFENTDSNIGLNSYYLDKQFGTARPGDVPDAKPNNTSAQVTADPDKPKFIVEKYIRSTSKDGITLPIQNGVNSLQDFNSEISRLSSINSSGHLSDYFGNLEFTYRGSFKSLMDKGFANQKSINTLEKLNEKEGIELEQLQSGLVNYIAVNEFEDFDVIYDNSFLLEGEVANPIGTKGELKINYGLRICMVLPQNYFTLNDITTPIRNASQVERSFYFQDNTMVVPLVSTEVAAVDQELSSYSSNSLYDLECLVNKLVETQEFKVMFNKVFPLQMFNSMSAIFNSENFLPSLGRGVFYDEASGLEVPERTEAALNLIEEGMDPDDWEGVSNEFLKNFLRREFRSAYLSNDIDGFSLGELSERERLRLFGSFNPFDIFSLPSIKIPWFKRRRLRTKVYDANGNECADPTKDFR